MKLKLVIMSEFERYSILSLPDANVSITIPFIPIVPPFFYVPYFLHLKRCGPAFQIILNKRAST